MNLITLMLALCAIGLCAAGPAAGQVFVDIPDGDDEALVTALCQAQDQPRTVIRLDAGGRYTASPRRWNGCRLGGRAGIIPIPPRAAQIMTEVTILGAGATLDLEGLPGFSVSREGRLIIRDLDLSRAGFGPALANRGDALLEQVTVRENQLNYSLSGDAVAPVVNRGRMTLRSTVLARNQLAGVPELLILDEAALADCAETASAGVLNAGILLMNNVTLFANALNPDDEVLPPGACVTRDLLTAAGARTTVSNSVITSQLPAGEVSRNCTGEVYSLGYNTVPGGSSCGFDAATDRVRADQFVPHGLAVRQAGRTLFVPDPDRQSAGSPAPPGSGEAACERRDVRGFLREDSCVSGALDPAASLPLGSGLDGLWFDPAQDGQYLNVSHIGNDRLLLQWQSFDEDGNAVWVYGVAASGERAAQVPVFRNTGVRVRSGEVLGDLSAQSWGELTLETHSCAVLYLTVAPDHSTPVTYTLQPITRSAAARCFDSVAYRQP